MEVMTDDNAEEGGDGGGKGDGNTAGEGDPAEDSGDKCGRREVCQVLLALLPVIVTAMSQSNFVFAAAATQYRCSIPECEDSPDPSLPTWWPANVDSKCSRPVLALPALAHASNCSTEIFTNRSEACSSWIYHDEDSIVSEFELACEEWKRALVGTVHNVGVFIAMPVMGYISDRWGRRLALTISACGAVLGALKPLTAWAMTQAGHSAHARYSAYLALELLEAAIATGTYTTAFVFTVEVLGENWRVASSVCLGLAVSVGELLLAALAWQLPQWRRLQLAIYCPALVFPALRLLLRESPRWKATVGKFKDSKHKLPIGEQTTASKDGQTFERFSLKLLFGSPVLLQRMAICSWWWFTIGFVYYGLVINSTGLPGSPTLNFGLTALASVPGDLLTGWSLRWVGRPKTVGFSLLLVSLCCIATAVVPEGADWLQVTLYLLGKANIALCFNAVYTYTSELMPTSARGSLVGACSMMARLGSVLAPFTPLLSTQGAAVPTVVFGGAALSGAALTMLTPDTRSSRLPDTVAQALAQL